MNLKTPITFSETGKVKKYEMIQSQGNKMDVKALAYLQRPNLAINQQFTCIKTHQISGVVVLVDFHFQSKFCLPNININQTVMCSF